MLFVWFGPLQLHTVPLRWVDFFIMDRWLHVLFVFNPERAGKEGWVDHGIQVFQIRIREYSLRWRMEIPSLLNIRLVG